MAPSASKIRFRKRKARDNALPFVLGVSLILWSSAVDAETISGALARAYRTNPDINQQRAGVRAADENIPKNKSGWFPKFSGAASYGSTNLQFENIIPSPPAMKGTNGTMRSNPRNFGLNAQQMVFDGFKTYNSVRQAESQVLAAREQLRQTEQTVLLAAATAYMNVLRDTAILGLRRNNIQVLEEQLRQTRVRFQVGEVTMTDVAQAQAALAQSRSDYAAAQAALQMSMAQYRQSIGEEPRQLSPSKPVENLLPKQLEGAVQRSQTEHPQVASALHNVDATLMAVKIAEAALYPNANISAQVQKLYDVGGMTKNNNVIALVQGTLNVPIYQGGAEYAGIRQAKEQVSQSQLNADLARNGVRAQVVTAWGQLEASKAQIISGQAAVAAAELALAGVREEARVGQRTTYDVLNQQQILLNTRVQLVVAQRDRVVNSYNVLAAIGAMNTDTLRLSGPNYDPTHHYEHVRNKFIGVTTPDGR